MYILKQMKLQITLTVICLILGAASITVCTTGVPVLVQSTNGALVPKASLASACASSDVANKTIYLMGYTPVFSNLSTPTNVAIRPVFNGYIDNQGYNVTFKGPVEFVRHKMLAGTGNFTFNGSHGAFFPEMWGVQMYPTAAAAVASGTATANTTAMNKAITDVYNSNSNASYLTSGGEINIASGVLITGAVTAVGKPNVSFAGQGNSSTMWLSSGSVNPLLALGKSTGSAQAYYFYIRDIWFQGGGAANSLLNINYAAYFNISRIQIQNDASTVTAMSTYGSLSYSMRDSIIKGGTSFALDVNGNNATNDVANNITIDNCEINAGTGGIGVRFSACNGVRMRGGAIEHSPGGGMQITATDSSGVGETVLLDGVWFEDNGGKDLEILGGTNFSNIVVARDLIMIGNNSTSTYGIYINGSGGGGAGTTAKIYNSQISNHATKDIYNTGTGAKYYYDCVAGSITTDALTYYNTYPTGVGGPRLPNTLVYSGSTNLPTGATPTLPAGNVFATANGGATNVTQLLGGIDGQSVTLFGADGGNTTIKNSGASAGQISMTGDVTLVNTKILILQNYNGVWYKAGGN